MQTIGFIGTGVMGGSMAGHLQNAGHPLCLFTRTRAKAQPLLDRGAAWADSPAQLAARCETVFTMVGYPSDVEEVYFGDCGLLTGMRRGALLVDMTTSQPALAERIAAEAERLGGEALDAPVSGGDKGAREATLSIMAGGSRHAYEKALPLLRLMGREIVYHGPAGSGQHCKLCNQIAIAANMVGVCEALAYARRTGLDPERVLRSISGGAAGSWSLANLAPRMLAGDFAPGFYVKHFVKDLGLALEAARTMRLDLPGLSLGERMYRELRDGGEGDSGTQALIKRYA
ncbi:MAG: NAD(P)-dependent oxidoreductase [Kiritimatiellae bacterium]|nr:NAD(P)-dependent oxidoreductase [Kiritimatiellia bacterium]